MQTQYKTNVIKAYNKTKTNEVVAMGEKNWVKLRIKDEGKPYAYV